MATKHGADDNNEHDEEDKDGGGPASSEGSVRPSIHIQMIRHAESANNQVYRDARRLFGGGTPRFDLRGWEAYVDEHRSDDPGLSGVGVEQAEKLAAYLVDDLAGRASSPVRIVTSPMRRTLETIRPTLERLGDLHREAQGQGQTSTSTSSSPAAAAAAASTSAPSEPEPEPEPEPESAPSASCIVNAFYHESEGCHVKDEPRPGMNRREISDMLVPNALDPSSLSFDGFDPHNADAGWYSHGTGPETRPESEERASRFYVWMCEYLDEQLAEASHAADVFDAGVDGAPLLRRTVLLIGHGDFMALLLKRIIAGFGYAHEREGITHRSAFVHWNTGTTDLEYFGAGRFLLMSSNQTPHLPRSLLTGGGLKDGWSYLMPDDKFVLEQEVAVAFSDEVDGHVQEQADALRTLYLDKRKALAEPAEGEVTLVVKRGLQVVGCASFHERTGRLSDVVVRPSVRGSQVGRALVDSAVAHAKKVGTEELVAEPDTDEAKAFFSKLGFEEGGEREDSIGTK